MAIAAWPTSAFFRLKSLFVKSWNTFLRVGRDKALVKTPPRFYTPSYDTVNGAPYSRIDLFARNGKTKVHARIRFISTLTILRNGSANPSVSRNWSRRKINWYFYLFFAVNILTRFWHIYIYCAFMNYFYLENLFTFYAWLWNTTHLLIILNKKILPRLSYRAKPLFIKEVLMSSNFSPRLFSYDSPLATEQNKQLSDIEILASHTRRSLSVFSSRKRIKKRARSKQVDTVVCT